MGYALVGPYTWEDLSAEQFEALYNRYYPQVFADLHQFQVSSVLSAAELDALQPLRAAFKNRYTLRLGVYRGDQFVGWHVGVQDTWDRFYMMNSAVLPPFRRQGIYAALVRVIIERVRDRGFQIIYSRHHAGNNAVIIPKLRAGFTITGFELTDQYGLLVQLSYYFNPTRRKVLHYRTGQLAPDDELRALLKLSDPRRDERPDDAGQHRRGG